MDDRQHVRNKVSVKVEKVAKTQFLTKAEDCPNGFIFPSLEISKDPTNIPFEDTKNIVYTEFGSSIMVHTLFRFNKSPS